MAAGTLIKIKRKAGAFVGAELAAGELGLDVTNSKVYSSVDGATVFEVTAAGGGIADGATLSTGLTFPNTGLHILDNNATHDLIIVPAENITADRTLSIVLGDADRTVTLAGALTLAGAFITSGANSLTLTTTGATNVTLPTSGTLATEAYVNSAVAGLLDYKGGYNAATNSPDLDVSPSGILKGDTYTVTAAGNFFSTPVEIGDVIIAAQDSPTLVGHWTLVQGDKDGLVTGPASATDAVPALFDGTTGRLLKNSTPTGTGNPVLATSPTLVTPVLGVATATSINKLAVTAPATSATLAVADGGTLATSGAYSITLTATAATNVTFPTTGTLATLAGTETLTNKTLSSSTNVVDGGTI